MPWLTIPDGNVSVTGSAAGTLSHTGGVFTSTNAYAVVNSLDTNPGGTIKRFLITLPAGYTYTGSVRLTIIASSSTTFYETVCITETDGGGTAIPPGVYLYDYSGLLSPGTNLYAMAGENDGSPIGTSYEFTLEFEVASATAEWINVTTLPGFSYSPDFGGFTESGGVITADTYTNNDPRNDYTGAQARFSRTGLPTGKVLTGNSRINVTTAVGLTYELWASASESGGDASSGNSTGPLTVLGTCDPNVLDSFAYAYVAEGIPNFGWTSITFTYEVEIDDAPPTPVTIFWTDIIGCKEET